MPYITGQARAALLEGQHPQTAGELNYVFCMMILGKLGQKSFPASQWVPTFLHFMVEYLVTHGNTYKAMNDAFGAAELAAREVWYRTEGDYAFGCRALRTAADEFWSVYIRPYERRKALENGDVFDTKLDRYSAQGGTA